MGDPGSQKGLSSYASHPRTPTARSVQQTPGWHTAPNLAVPDGIRPVYLPPYSPELQPAEHLWPALDEPLANQYFATLADLEHVVTERCRVLNHDSRAPWTERRPADLLRNGIV